MAHQQEGTALREPTIIQGGMGVGVSSWRLAREVGMRGHLGVVSGTAAAVVQARRLALGDPGGHVRRALERFPHPAVARRVLDRHLGTSDRSQRFRGVPAPSLAPGRSLVELTVVGTFVEVFLAKEGHDGPIGVNLLEKIQLPTPASLYGAMLAGVDHVLIGAGVPVRIPRLLDDLSQHRPVALPVAVVDAPAGAPPAAIRFDPAELGTVGDRPLARPRFLAIVSSATLAAYLARSATGAPDGFVVETPRAGGHNAPPRGALRLDERGEPVYGPRDAIDLEAIRVLGLPFWVAGGTATREGLAAARAAGAVGIQVGTAFAFCDSSGLDPGHRSATIRAAIAGATTVRTDPSASPTGYPFKVLEAEGTLSDGSVYDERPRRCDLGYLRETYLRPDGRFGYRCSAEPVDDYVRKGGTVGETVGRRCLCNGLLATIGLGQIRGDGTVEPALLTAGDDVAGIVRFLGEGATSYSAGDVLDHLLSTSADDPARQDDRD